MSAQVFAVKKFHPVWASGAAIRRTGFWLHATTTAKPGTGFLQLYNHYSSQERLFSFFPRRVDFGVSIDIRQHPIVRKTTHSHIATPQATSGQILCNFL